MTGLIDALTSLAALSVPAFSAALFVAQTATRELGYAVGRWRADGAEREGAGLLTGAILAILAFVLALTLTAAGDRFAERRAGTLAEANAIGTAWLRTQTIDDPRAAEARQLIEAYAAERAAFVRVGLDPAEIERINARSSALGSAIWGHVAAIARERPDAVVAALIAATNEMLDAATGERFAFAFGIPPNFLIMLLLLALVGMATIGFQLGLRGQPHRVLAVLLTIAWTAVLMQILDLGAARLGTLRTNAVVYEWTIEGFATPPPPGQVR